MVGIGVAVGEMVGTGVAVGVFVAVGAMVGVGVAVGAVVAVSAMVAAGLLTIRLHDVVLRSRATAMIADR